MRTKSSSTSLADPYRAALALGTALAPIEPEVVFVFCTIHYDNWDEFTAGLYDGLGNDAVKVIGCSGDGFLEQQQVSDVGACALGINSQGKARWHLAYSTGVHANPQASVRDALAQLRSAMDGRDPAFYFLLSDFNTDASQIEIVLRDEISVPVIGGMAGDDNSLMERCVLFANQQMVPDAVVMLACEGTLPFQIHIGNSIATVGSAGLVEGAHGKIVQKIGGMSAAQFIARETGKPVLRSDQGSIALTLANTRHPGEKKLRAMMASDGKVTDSIRLHGGIEDGDMVQVCMATRAQLQQEVVDVAKTARDSGFMPSAALVISCAGRKWMLGGQVEFEVQNIADAFPDGSPDQAHGQLPIVGFPSFGEIGPLTWQGRYTRNLFHNMTYVLLLLGGRDE